MENGLHIWNLITKKLSGEASGSEEAELQQALREQPPWQYAYEMLSKWWGQQDPSKTTATAVKSWEHLKGQLGEHEPDSGDEIQIEPTEEYSEEPMSPQKNRGKRIFWLTGVLVVLLAAGMFFLRNNNPVHFFKTESKSEENLSEVSTRYGSKSKVTLPDGTTVWLNSGSNLFYNNKNFGETNREVSLTGEAFFNVTHDPDHPFIIHAGKINVKVLGTSFDVKNYPDEKTVEATLIKGSIEIIFANDPGRKVLLRPDEKLTVYNNDEIETKNLKATRPEIENEYKVSPLTILPEDSTIVETSWVQNKLAFSSESFALLALQMERWYNVKINLTGAKVQQYHFTGIFKDETLDQALKALQITAPFHFKIEKNEVYISNP